MVPGLRLLVWKVYWEGRMVLERSKAWGDGGWTDSSEREVEEKVEVVV
jgi:hypothetical protein